jgi:sugar/nucleoside kinase (ribokinase family)
MQHLFVIGGASTDLLHTAEGATINVLGGAGMYTAMAARRSGLRVSLFAPRPEPLLTALKPVIERLHSWLGPLISPKQLAHFEISHQNGQTTYLQASVGAEADLTPSQLPDDLSPYDVIHIIPLGSARRQLDFVQTCRLRGARCISIGTALDIIQSDPQLVRQAMAQAAYSFMNENEARALWGRLDQIRVSPDKVLFVTRGAQGCQVVQGEHHTVLDTQPVVASDPTGAGDTFCGATLAGLLGGAHPVMAARDAMPLAAQMTEHFGPAALFWSDPPPPSPTDTRVLIDQVQVQRVAQIVAKLPEVQPFDFVGLEFPPVDCSEALDLFFASTLQQFGFWSIHEGRYHQPLIASINGKLQKGSTYLALTYLRALYNDPESFRPARQAQLSAGEMQRLFQAEDGTNPMPALELHLAQAQQYGHDLLALGLTPTTIIEKAYASATPLQTFLRILDQIGGYKEDPLRKKASLLALILSQRPEGFLCWGETETVAPVIDYHLMRSCLRTGLLDVRSCDLREKLELRQVLSPKDEWAVRWAAYQVIEQIEMLSGKSMGAVDWFFFNARKRCPEMAAPNCAACSLDPVCAHDKALFQPVIRTTFY